MDRPRKDGIRGNALGLIAIVIALGGTAVATTSGGGGERVVVQKRIVQAQKAGALKAAKGRRGPRGPSGPQGPAGAQGAPGAHGPPGTSVACVGNGSGDTMVSAGSVCIDRYEVSIWSSPTGGTQYGVGVDDYPCSDNGQDCKPGTAGEIYARSVPGVTPSGAATYFQAQAALANVGKRLPSNAEWQQAAIGTPDPGASPGSEACNTNSGGREPTGERANCISQFGANDMIGNSFEIAADWGEESTDPGGCTAVGALFGSDASCFGAGSGNDTAIPGFLLRGGSNLSAAGAGVFAEDLRSGLYSDFPNLAVGFRGAR